MTFQENIYNDSTQTGELANNKQTSANLDFEDGVEIENLENSDETDKIIVPFDPTKIDVDIATVNLGSLIDELEDGIIDMNTDFQRASDVWDVEKKSRLIESILLGLPIPSFYFSENPKTQKFDVIDGLQRICAIKDFVIDKRLKLTNLQFLNQFENWSYDDLGRPEQRRIKSLKITKNTLRKDTPNEVKYVIFQRVNTAGVPLEPQEMRHALNQGSAAEFIAKIARMESFKRATANAVKEKRMQDRDFANRFVAFYIGFDNYGGELDTFLNEKMETLNSMTQERLDEIELNYRKSLDCCYQIFEGDTFRKKLPNKRGPISKAIFDTLCVNVAWLTDDERSLLERNAPKVREKMQLLLTNKPFNDAISVATGQRAKVELRFNAVKNMLKMIISDDN
ncbi:MAG: DUF262 domain-containing protein [Rikenellaceae bacterium]